MGERRRNPQEKNREEKYVVKAEIEKIKVENTNRK